MMPEKTQIIDLNNYKNINEFQFSDLPLDNQYAVLVKTGGKIKFDEVLRYSETLGETLVYGDKNYYTFDTIDVENELHYDGISSGGVRPIPDWLIFYLEDKPAVEGGEFRVLNCESVLYDLDQETIDVLENIPLELYGLKYYFEPNPKPYDLSFSINTIVNEGGARVLRMHLPTDDVDFVTVERDYVYCKIDSFRLRFKGMNGVETAEIFDRLRKVCYSEKHLMEISLDEGDILFMNNRYAFHGRKKCATTTTRVMHRIQVVCK